MRDFLQLFLIFSSKKLAISKTYVLLVIITNIINPLIKHTMNTIENVTDFAFTYKGTKVPVIWQFARGINKDSEAVVLGFYESDMCTGGISLVLDVDGNTTRSFVGIDGEGVLFSDIMKPSHHGEPVPFRYNG